MPLCLRSTPGSPPSDYPPLLHSPRQNYTVLANTADADGKVTDWAPLPGADPLFAGASEYSTLFQPTQDPGTFFVCYERGGTGDAVLHLTQLRLP